MAPISELPPPTTFVGAPAAFSPSQLAGAGACLLRIALQGSPSELLSAHPAAELGRAFHRLLELASRGQVGDALDPEAQLRRVLDSLLNDAQTRAEQTAGGSVPDLRLMYSPLAWQRKVRTAIDVALKYLAAPTERPAGAARRRVMDFSSLPSVGRWSEIPIEVPALRLAGRADLVEKSAGEVVIRDLKSGRVTDDLGDLLPHIDLQMRLYGLMASALSLGLRVGLVVDHGEVRRVPFSDEICKATEAWLLEVTGRLSATSALDAVSLGVIGDACLTCNRRHICPLYRSKAPELWGHAGERRPLDTWGTVQSIEVRPDGLLNLIMSDAADRRVRVFGVQTRRGLEVGAQVWFFGLATSDGPRAQSVWRHPVNFFEVADDGRGRAWALTVFIQSNGS